MECSRQEVRLDCSNNVVYERGHVHRLDPPPTLGSSSQPLTLTFSLTSAASVVHFRLSPATYRPIPIQHQPSYGTQPSLALPPPAHHGPRSPGLVMHRSHTRSPERRRFSRPSLLATMPSTTSAPSEVSSGGASKLSVPPLGIVVARREDDGDDDDNGKENICTSIRPIAKALGKRRRIAVEVQIRTRSTQTTFSTSVLMPAIQGAWGRMTAGSLPRTRTRLTEAGHNNQCTTFTMLLLSVRKACYSRWPR